MAFRKALPLRQRLPYQGQRRRPPPAAETGSRCWGRGQQDASDSAADAGCRNPALSNEVRLRGWTKDSLTGKLLLNSTSPSRLRRATSPTEGRLWHSAKPCLLARGSPTKERSETERLDEGQPDREALAELNLSVTADAVPPPLPRGGLGIPQSLASSPEAPLLGELAGASPTERLDEGQPDRKPLTFGHSETGDAVCLYIICPMTAA